MKKVEIYAEGIVNLSVCADSNLSPKEVEREVNLQSLTQWHLSTNKTFADGQPNPKVCENDPKRTHYLLHC